MTSAPARQLGQHKRGLQREGPGRPLAYAFWKNRPERLMPGCGLAVPTVVLAWAVLCSGISWTGLAPMDSMHCSFARSQIAPLFTA
ncbi:hypothetical protein ACFWAY_14650 [Rhodococcus sp. NPDC059968]|uniref:hypothetical protein n=1 Tax=Rhodococcus sp. NPDC059968 TaxID=3347017 RepID=UPI003671E407